MCKCAALCTACNASTEVGSLAVTAGSRASVTCRAEKQAAMGHKRVLLLAHGKKAETPEFKEAYAWLEKDGHDVDMIKTSGPDDMSKGVEKWTSHFDGEAGQHRLCCNTFSQLQHGAQCK